MIKRIAAITFIFLLCDGGVGRILGTIFQRTYDSGSFQTAAWNRPGCAAEPVPPEASFDEKCRRSKEKRKW